ncbi:hypothetical protein [Okeania sp. SIO2G5]|uniref:hypothetical protein n=1 Tax=Okeania sp. SIO2G5 TaxID=2607796 RepID=UPI0013BF00ED|nr:hypothetical protein [Okeania sp. SIO2G5]NEP76032.1 hypothetical protein [Okeania sp. SIO2G5]
MKHLPRGNYPGNCFQQISPIFIKPVVNGGDRQIGEVIMNAWFTASTCGVEFDKTVSAKIPGDWKQKLEDRAQHDSTTVGELMRGLVANYLNEEYGDRLTQLERRIGVIEGKLKSLAG